MRTRKRSLKLSLVLIFAVLIGALIGTAIVASADATPGYISEMHFTVTAPQNGNTYDTNIVSEEPDKYTATFERVWDNSKSSDMSDTDEFVHGGIYDYVFNVNVASGYSFDANTKVYLNGKETSYYNINERYVELRVPIKIEVIGGSLYTGYLYDEKHTGDIYAYEYAYLYADSAPEGKVFHKWKITDVKEGTEEYRNSAKTSDYFYLGTEHMIYEAIYAIPLDNIEICIPIEIGKTLAETVPFGLDENKDNYTIEIKECYYYDSESHKVTLNPTDAFEKGKRYNFDFYIHSKEGYVYSQNGYITVNGNTEYGNSTNYLENYSYYTGVDLYDLVPITVNVTGGKLYKGGELTEETEFLGGTELTVVVDESQYPEGELFKKWSISNSYWVTYGDLRDTELTFILKKPSSDGTVVGFTATYASPSSISYLSVDTVHPEVGKTPSDYTYTSYNDLYLEVVGWYLDGELLAPDYVFEAGKTYAVRIKATAAPSYYFDSNTANYRIFHEFSGAFADADEVIVEYGEGGAYIIYEAVKVAKAKQGDFNVNVVTPAPGAHPSDTLTYDENVKCEVTFEGWEMYDSELAAWREMTDEDIFAVGGKYRVSIDICGTDNVFLPEGGFAFTINGQKGERYSMGTFKSHYTEGYELVFTVEAAPETYSITVENGTATVDSATVTECGAGLVVTLTANTPESGKAFKMWKVESGENVFFVDAKASVTTFIMPAGDVTVTAIYRNIPSAITVTGGTADWAEAAKDETVILTVGEIPTNQYFAGWRVVSGGVTIADANAKTTTFVMGESAVEIEAIFEDQTLLSRLDFTLSDLKGGLVHVDDLTSVEPDKYTGTFDTIKGDTGVAFVMGDPFTDGARYIYYFYLEIDEKYRIDSGTAIYINGNSYCYRNTVDGRIRCHTYLSAIHTINVVNGKAYLDSECTVPITHAKLDQYFYVVFDEAPSGKKFAGWEISGDAWYDSSSKEVMNVRQRNDSLTITATYKDLRTINVTTGTADLTEAIEGETVNLTKGEAPLGKYQIGWSANGGETIKTDKFTMPDEDVVVTPVYHDHVYSTWGNSGSYHWQNCTDPACPDYNGSQRAYENHVYDNICDTTCDTCGYVRTVAPHVPMNDDGDCTTAVTCQHCDYIFTPANANHTKNDDDGDCTTAVTCEHCDYVFTPANASHTPEANDDDCTTAVKCANCDAITTPANASHTKNDDDGDCTTAVTCEHCDYIFTPAEVNHTPGTDDGDCTTAVNCANTGCTKVATAANASHTPEADDDDCTTAVKCANCDAITTPANANHTKNDDDGDCTTAVTCEHCDYVFTPANASHTPEADDGDCTTAVKCANCDAITTPANASHTPEADDGDCTTAVKCANCDAITTPAKATHTSSGAATVEAAEVCTVCGHEIAPKLQPAPAPAPDSGEAEKDGLGAGAIVAIVLSSLAAAGGGFVLVWFFIKKRG